MVSSEETETLPPVIQEQPPARQAEHAVAIGHAVLAPEAIQLTQGIEVPDRIMSADEMNDWAKKHTFGDHNKRGTFRTEDRENFLYIKACLKVNDEADVTPALAMARYLTSAGVLNPDTQWGAFKNDKDEYQLFPVSPALTAVSIDDLYDDPDKFAAFTRAPDKPDSFIQEWCRRADPNYVSTSPAPWKETSPADSPVSVLNTFEALHTGNWGYDKKGNFYPVDVEVINLQDNMDTVRKWYAGQSAHQAQA